MGTAKNHEADVRFILVPDPQVVTRLLPVVASLALTGPVEDDEGLDGQEPAEDSVAPND